MNRTIILLLLLSFVSIPCVCQQGVSSDLNAAAESTKVTPVSQQTLTARDDYARPIEAMLHAEQFDGLDRLASTLRTTKERYNGGVWKLFTFYYAVALPAPGSHATEEDWQAHLDLLQRWVMKRPESVTARVALADAYMSYAWDARGDGFADKVTSSGWRLFKERAAKARSILEDAAKLPEKCPQWFVVMEDVALAQGWDRADEQRLLERAIAFAPDYLYIYRSHAQFILPKWYGEEGEAAAFVDAIANRMGKDAGEAVYFDLAYNLTCHCAQEVELTKLSWPRIQKGFALLEKSYGPNAWRLNQLAYMATKVGDGVVAKSALDRLQGNWDESVWGNR